MTFESHRNGGRRRAGREVRAVLVAAFRRLAGAQGASLAFTTYQTGKLFLLGLQPDGRLAVFERTFSALHGPVGRRPHAVAERRCTSSGASRTCCRPGGAHRRARPVYVAAGRPTSPATSTSTTSAIDGRRPAGVRQHAVPLPRHASATAQLRAAVAAAVHQHAGGRGPLPPQRPGPGGRPAALRHRGQPTATWPTAGATGARDGGCVIDVATGEIVLRGPVDAALAAPARRPAVAAQLRHRRVRQRRSRARRVRAAHVLPGLPARAGLRRRLRGGRPVAAARQPHLRGPGARRGARRTRRRAALRPAGDRPRTGDAVDWLRIEGMVRELYDVAVLPGVRNPAALGFKTDEIQRVITIDES